ncbi:MAG: hypothetical protein L6R42_008622, partial [Xanthoria sp. 1 TBL-2021]
MHRKSQQPEPLAAEPTQSAIPKGARLKGKARKAAKDAAGKAEEPSVDTSESLAAARVKHTITTGELIRQAEAVAQSYLKFDEKMPASLQSWSNVPCELVKAYLLHRDPGAVSEATGTLCGSEGCWFRATNQDEPLLERNSVTNRFSSLKMEETPEVDPTEVPEVAAAINSPAKTKASQGEMDIAVYELEDEDEFDEELAFIIFCFFEDLHRTQELINDSWRKYKAKKCDLRTAAVTTNGAFDLVR